MAITAYNTTYFDDFNISDAHPGNNLGKTVAEKNYLRILFKPGYSVQVRELNQLQSILQSQIDRLGSSIYKDGSAVLGGNCTFDNNVAAVDVSIASSITDIVTTLNNVRIVSNGANSTGLTANLLGYKVLSVNSVRLYVRYNKSIQDIITLENVIIFPLGTTGSTIYIENSIILGNAVNTPFAAGAFLSEGIFYTKGSFVWTPKQAVFLDKVAVDSLVNQLIVIGVTESIVNYSTDGTLLDNATGMPNYSAPGADRYTIDLSLAFIETDSLTDLPISTSISPTNYIKLLTIKNSQCLETIKKLYTSLDDVLATRTYEESGNYTLSPFKITLREFYNDGENGGKYTVDEMPIGSFPINSTNVQKKTIGETLYSISLDPAVAYIKGYRVELTEARNLYSTKSRGNILTGIGVHSSAQVGNYIVGSFNHGSALPSITNPVTEYEIHGETHDYYDWKPEFNLLGTCKIRAVDGTPDAIRLHLFDIKLKNDKYLSDAHRIYLNQGGSIIDFAISGVVTLMDAQHSTGLFPIPYGTTQKVEGMSYTYDKLFTGSYDKGTGDTTFNIGTTDIGDTSSLICTNVVSTKVELLSGTVSGNLVIIYGKNVSSAIIPIIVLNSDGNQKSKIIETVTELLAAGSSSRMLANGDIIKINAVSKKIGFASADDVTSLCSISDDGQRDNYYTNSSINVGALTGPLYIKYDRFVHKPGDYFTISSYPETFLYDDIPSYKGTRLSDVYDFRPLVLLDPTTLAVVSPVPSYAPLDPDSIITSTIDYYLPKIDTVIVDSNGIFSVIPGEPALDPKAPAVPVNAMGLYTLDIPAYTYSPKDITVNYIDNRRFTMRDIGGIEQRISNIEYYTSLSLLETSAQNASIPDPVSSVQRLKNGYIVDAFTGHSIGDPTNVGYACSMDMSVGLLRPMFNMKNVRLIPSNVSKVSLHAHTITMPYTSRVLINQSYASDTLSVNPYDVAVFSGNVELIPSSDNWKDTINGPDLIINDSSAYDAVALTASTNDAFGFTWNEWQTNWTGTPTITTAFNNKAKKGSRLTTVTVTPITLQRTGAETSLGYTDQTQSLGNRAIDISYIPYIRPIKIYFNGTKLKPNTKLYAFFDGINVTSYCNQLTNIPTSIITATDTAVWYDLLPSTLPSLLGKPIVTDEFGNVQGEFYIPNNKINKFKCGQRIFKLTDSPTNTISESTTVADNQYIASGTTETQQETILSIRKPEIVTTAVSQEQAANVVNIAYSDPLAQTFLIPNVEEGLFATGLDLFFSAKSNSLPVSAYIVLVSNGIPTQQIMPFSMVTIQAADIQIDVDKGSIATRFEFSDPVYLLNGTEYAIVVTSNSADYRIWVATVGGIDVASNTAITKNAYNGVLLMSQNASTWTPEQTKDMKFVMYYAEFDIKDANVTFTQHLSGGITSIDASSITDVYSGIAPTVIIDPPGITATATAIISSGVITGFSIYGGTNYTLPPLVQIINAASGVHAKAHAVLNGTGGVSSIEIDNGGSGYNTGITRVVIDPPGITATAIANKNTDTISNIIITNPGSGYTSAPDVTIQGNNYIDTYPLHGTVESVDVSLFNLNRNAIAVNKTMITDSLNMNNSQYPIIIPNENYAANAQLNISNTSSAIALITTMSSSSTYLSPVIDIERNSLICVNNIIGPDPALSDPSDSHIYPSTGIYSTFLDTELSHNAGNTKARYITRPIVLNNASDKVDIYINVNRPITNSGIRVYVQYDNDTTWNLFPSLPQNIPVSSDPSVFTEIHYTDLSTKRLFTSFTIKIVMFSDTQTQVPTIKDFRAIATF